MTTQNDNATKRYEHAILERMLIIYENGAQHLSNETFSTKVLLSAADLIREVTEDHKEWV